MKNIYSKLNNNDGKTILMALFLLLVAVVVSVVVITAASTAAHQLNDNKEAQQAYLTVSSAAQLFRDEISKEEQKYVYTAYEYYRNRRDTEPFSKSSPPASEPTGELSELLTNIAKGIMEGNLGNGESEYKSGNINISTNGSEAVFDDVSVKIYVQYAGKLNNVDNYDMDIAFEVSGKSNDEYGYKMNLHIPITKQVGTEVKKETRIQDNNGYYYTCYVTTTTTTITFGNGILTRDGINADGGVQ